MSLEQKDVKLRACRICLDVKTSKSRTLDQDDWAALYEYCFGLKITTEDIPRKICFSCQEKVKTFSDFKRQAEKSDKLWKSLASVNLNFLAKETIKKEVIKIEDSSDDDFREELPISEQEEDHDSLDNNINESNNDQLGDILEGDNQSLICKRCKRPFRCKRIFIKHVKRKQCHIIEEDTEENAIKTPKVKLPKAPEYYCGLCDMKSEDENKVREHLVSEHSSKNDLECKLCDYMGRDFADMATHRYSHHPKEYKIDFNCHLCTKKSQVLLKLQFHYRYVHLKNNKGGLCTVCDRQFTNYKNWRNHERLHTTDEKFTCDICGRDYLFRNDIIDHLRDHSDYKGYVCDLCGRGFKRNSNLKLHIETVHFVDEVKCSHCDKRFRNPKCLQYHLAKLNKEKSHQCEYCSKCYSDAHTLKKHLVWHLNDRPFSCNVCGATYKVKSQLRIHQRKHTGDFPYKCAQCSKAFACSNQLKTHMSVHSGLRRHKCPFCDRSFHYKKLMVLHCSKRHNVTEMANLGKKEFNFTEG